MGTRPTILVVDDDPISSRFLTGLLEDDFHVLNASDGCQALAMAAIDPPPDLILLDVQMPGMSGYEICAHIKESDNTRHIPVMFVSAMDEAEDEVTGLALGAVDYVTKPISQPILLARIRTHLALNSARRRLTAIADHLLEGVALVDRNDRLQLVNKPALRLMGLNFSPKSLIGTPREMLFCLQQPPPGTPPWLQVIATGETYIDGDAVFVSPSGHDVAVSFGCAPLISPEHGRMAIVSFRDISKQKRLQVEAMQAARQAVVGHLAAGIAHEINTPAQFIIPNLEYIHAAFASTRAAIDAARSLADAATVIPALANQCADFRRLIDARGFSRLLEEVPTAITESQTGMARIASLVISMKEFAQPGTTDRSLTDINRVIENAVTISCPSWSPIAELHLELAQNLPSLECYANDLGQVFINLIFNAAQAIIDSTADLPGRIVITTKLEADQIVIQVSDNGCGVAADIREHIFDPFFTTRPTGAGTGLGLAICHDVITIKHGGSISVNAGKLGEETGAIFTIRLPVYGRANGCADL